MHAAVHLDTANHGERDRVDLIAATGSRDQYAKQPRLMQRRQEFRRQLPLALESGRRHGMVPMTDVLIGFVQGGVVDVREAFRKTHDRDRLLSGLKREGVDTSVVERLA